jgi:chemotaxis protein MotB
MMSGKKKSSGGGHGVAWVITFADLMSLLMAFFVMIVSFSIQDEQKASDAAGSIRDALGGRVESVTRLAGVIERNGMPMRQHPSSISEQPDSDDGVLLNSDKQGADTSADDAGRLGEFIKAAISLRQSLNDLPDVAETSKQIIVAETKEGINIILTDQDQRAMFGLNSSKPTPLTRTILAAIAPTIAELQSRVRITGHASSQEDTTPVSAIGKWKISSDRAMAAADILQENGMRDDQLEEIGGKGDGEPLILDNPSMAANRRIEIELLREAPPFPRSSNE